MFDLSEFEQAVVDKLLAGEHVVLATLRRQSECVRVTKRDHSSVGFFCDLEVEVGGPILSGDFQIGDVHAELEGVAHGAGFVLFVRGGRLSLLEGYTYDEPWPNPVRGYSLTYSDPIRKLELARLDLVHLK